MSRLNSNYLLKFVLISTLNLILVNTQEPTVEQKGEAEEAKYKNPEEEKKQNEYFNLMQDFNNEWENKMIDYNSDYSYNIPLRPRIQEIYYENVTTVPSVFKGAFIITDESTDKIEFIVKDPNNKVIHQITSHHNVFEIPINITGRYTIIFNNRISKSNVMITFTMSNGQNKLLNANDLTKTEQKLEALNTVIKKFNLEFKFGHDIHSKRYKSKFMI
jgi:hypothetical protein